MSVEFAEDRVPVEGIEEAVEELVELYGGEVTERQGDSRTFILPLRRGVATSGGVECTLAWNAENVTMRCDREVDAPKVQRIALLSVGVIGALLFTVWPFFGGKSSQFGTLAWIGGAVALAVYFLTLRRTSGGIAFDFLQRVVRRQRGE